MAVTGLSPKVGAGAAKQDPILQALGKFGVTRMDEKTEAPRRMIVNVSGLEKSGKTNFVGTCPGPILYISIDFGDEGVIDKFSSSKAIYPLEVKIDHPRGASPLEMANLYDEYWKNICDVYYGIFEMKSGRPRTIAVDTATELWEILRMARFGKLTQVKPHHYGPVNAEFRRFIRKAYESDVNLVLLSKLKEEWKDKPDGKGGTVGERTGEYIRAGWSDLEYNTQVNVRVWKDPAVPGLDKFHLHVEDCRRNPMMEGEEYVGETCGFPYLAADVFGVSPKEWM